MRTLLLILVVLAVVVGGALHFGGPWLETEGYKLPWGSPPRAPYVVSPSGTEVALGDVWGVRVAPFFDRPLLRVQGELQGLPGVEQVTFYELDGEYATLIPVSYSTDLEGTYELQLTITDHRRRMHHVTVPLVVVDKDFAVQRLTMSSQQTGLLTTDRTAEDRAKVRAARANPSPVPLWAGPLLMPVQGRLTTEFGLVRYVNNAPYSRHSGLDIAAPRGTPVQAATSGRVTFSGSLWVSGETVIIDHGLGMFTAYNHLSKLIAEQGQMVSAGDIIGEIGSTGFSTGPHLHFTLWFGSVPSNPWPWFEQDPRVLLGLPPKAVDQGNDGGG